MSEEANATVDTPSVPQDLDKLLQHQFVQDLLRLVSEIRTVIGDTEGKLENHQVVDRIREAMKK